MNILTHKKKCTKCGIEKPLVCFRKQKGRKDGFGSECLVCHREDVRKYNAAHPEKARESHKKWVERNLEKDRARKKKWREEHIEHVIQNNKDWYVANAKRVFDNVKRWQKENPDRTTIYRARRRANKRGAGGKITIQEWKDLCNKYGNKCLCCGRTDVKLTLDHVIPLKMGGENTIGNSQPLCRSCNSKKSTKTIDYRH